MAALSIDEIITKMILKEEMLTVEALIEQNGVSMGPLIVRRDDIRKRLQRIYARETQ